MSNLTPKQLKELKFLKIEIEQLAKEIVTLRPEYVTDSTKDYRSGYPHTITISGLAVDKEGKLRRRLERKQEELQEQILEMETWLDSIQDSEMRQILRLRYRNRLSWQKIAFEIGGNDEQYPRRKCKKFFENIKFDEFDEK